MAGNRGVEGKDSMWSPAKMVGNSEQDIEGQGTLQKEVQREGGKLERNDGEKRQERSSAMNKEIM